MARNWIECALCGKRALVLVGAAFCSRECNRKRNRQRERHGVKARSQQQTEAAKYREAMGKVRL